MSAPPTFNPVDVFPAPRRPPFAWVTWLLVSSTVAVFLLQLLEAHRTGEDVIGDALSFSPQALAEHRYWTILTYAWAHAVAMFGDSGLFWLHIVSNMLPLAFLGPALEEMLGHLRFLALYLGGAVVSALVWIAFDATGDPTEGIIGASGAVFALIAAVGVAMPRAQVTVLLFFVIPLRMRMGVMALAICAVEAVSILVGWMPEVAHSAHLGGAAFGLLYFGFFRLRHRRAFVD